MDPNGGTFHLLLTGDDWLARGPIAPEVSVDESGSPELEWRPASGLTAARRGFLFSRTPGSVTLDPGARRGADRDRYGAWYAIGDDRRSVIRTLRDGSTSTVWPPGPGSAPDPGPSPFRPSAADEAIDPAAAPGAAPLLRGLVVTADHRLVVATTTDDEHGDPGSSRAGLLVFDLYGGRTPLVVELSPDVEPIDLHATDDGRLLILDAAAGGTRYWCLDRTLTAPVTTAAPPGPFQPKDADEPSSPAPPVLDGGFAIAVPNPVAIESLGDGTVLVLGRDDAASASTLFRFVDGEPAGPPLSLAGLLADFVEEGDEPATGADVVGHDLAVLAVAGDDHTARRELLFISDVGGDQAFAATIGDDDTLLVEPDYYPMRLHHGRGLTAADDSIWFDTLDGWHRLVASGRQRHATGGTYTSTVFDSDEPGCVWHRIFIDGDLPSGTAVDIETRAADTVEQLTIGRWHREPPLYLGRGPVEVDAAGRGSTGSRRSTAEDTVGTWETLLQRATGRFLQFRLRLSRSGDAPPRLRALRLHFPRFSYREQYLPRIYGRDRQAGDLLDRFLANPEGLYTAIETRIADAQTLLDHRTAPNEALDWLIGWIGEMVDADWEPFRKRAFLANANRLFESRGTRPGLIAAIRLATDADPCALFEQRQDSPFAVRIVERYATRRFGAVRLGDPTGPADLPLVDDGRRWSPELGGTVLASRYAAFVGGRRPDAPADDRILRPTTPTTEPAREDWTVFVATELGVAEPRFGPSDLPVYRRFLVQRYGRFGRYLAAYGDQAAGSSFDAVPLPTTLPMSGPPLRDWAELVSRVIPMAGAAHRFSVLVPVPLDVSDEQRQLLIDRVSSVVARQRPAHTVFDVRPFWAALNVGTARVGLETQVGLGSRFAATVVGRSRLAKSYTAAGDRFRHRQVVGERLDRPTDRPSLPSNRRETRP